MAFDGVNDFFKWTHYLILRFYKEFVWITPKYQPVQVPGFGSVSTKYWYVFWYCILTHMKSCRTYSSSHSFFWFQKRLSEKTIFFSESLVRFNIFRYRATMLHSSFLSHLSYRWVLLIRFGRFLSYFCFQSVSRRESVAGYTTDETYRMKQKEPER